MNDYSIVVAGAGPTGLVLANLLGQAGVKTLLVEANPATVGEPRAVSIDDESLRVMQAIGIVDLVRSETVSGYGSEYRSPGGELFLKVKPTSEPYGYPRRNAFRQPVLEAQLREALSRYSCVETRFQTRVDAVAQSADGVEISLQTPAGAEFIRADYLAGCDGASSGIRQALGFQLEGSSLDERWLIIDLENSPAPSPETIVFCDPKRPCIALPGPHRTRRYEFKLLGNETDEEMLDPDRIDGFLKGHEAAPGSKIIRTTIYHFHARVADHWGAGRIWLAGDAAHLMPPFAGQGMNGGIRDAANLGWKLAAVVQGRAGPKLLETFESERRGHVWQMIRLALRMGSIMGPRTALHGLATRAAFRVLGLWPAARSYFAEMKYKPAPRFDAGFLISRLLTRNGLVGRMIPQPRIMISGKKVLLDDLLGLGFSLLAVEVDQSELNALSLGAEWDSLIDRRVALRGCQIPDLQLQNGQVLLIRPDRYVMANFRLQDVSTIASELKNLLASTWKPKEVGASEMPDPLSAHLGSGAVSSPSTTPTRERIKT